MTSLLGNLKKPTLIFTVIVFLSVSASLPTQTNAPKLLPDYNGTVSLNGRIVSKRTKPGFFHRRRA